MDSTKMPDLAPAECMSPHGGLDELIILGVTHKTANSMEEISSLVIPDEQQAAQLTELKDILDAEELVYVSTCNRASFILLSRRPPAVLFKVLRTWLLARSMGVAPPPMDQWIILQGRQALEHLLLVATSLDSMVIGERQIFGQFKQAFVQARASGISGPKMHFLYEQILAIAKQVYTNTPLSEGRLSVASLAEDRLAGYCARHKRVTAILVGAGKMIEHVAAFLNQRDGVRLLFVNRTQQKSDAFAQRFGGASLSLESFMAERPAFNILATSTSAPHYLFGKSFFEAGHHPHERLVIDLAIPPDVDPAAAELDGITLLNMDALRRQSHSHEKKRKNAIHEAQRILTEGAENIVENWRIRMVNPAIGAIRRRYEREGLELLQKLLDEELPNLESSEKEALTRWIQKLAKRWAVIHASGIKQVARQCCMKAVKTYLEGVGVDRIGQ